MDKEEAKAKVAELVAKYEHLGPAEVKSYHEAKTKQGFIQPLFQHLGWDFLNTDEVAPEEKASKGRVDYAFKLRGVSQFCLEAKPLKADLTDYIQQAVTYAYNKGVTWAVLTNFEHLQVFNAQSGHPVLNLNCKDYLLKFDRLWLLSRESLEAGALNKEAAEVGALPPPLPVEKRLYSQLRQWREELFNQLHLHNPHLPFPQIDETIQRLFNRLIFIRTCEDRGIEEKILLSTLNQWKSGGRKGELIEALCRVFRQYEGFYDSDLFMLHPLDQAYIESDTLERIIDGLYQVPGGMASYDFSVIDADVLGAVYEQYLGHVAAVVKKRAREQQARLGLGLPSEGSISLEEKKQKRKEAGIYYTPKWVVDYIVKQTVRRFIQEHSHNEILNMKILDPACGSGSFLIRAYDELLSYHAGTKSKAPEELDQYDRLPILEENIFGVDLDMQAVEIARLNLLIRALARREILPTLADNIRQGNSLISGGEAELKPYFGDAWRDKKPFNWEEQFSQIMKSGGFDVVIGNPPYAGFHGFGEDKLFFRDHYNCATGRFDLYMPFIERGLQLLKERGVLGFICPTNFMKRQHGAALRRLLRDEAQIEVIVDFEHGQVFEEAINYTCVLVLRTGKPERHLVSYYPGAIDKEPYMLRQSELSTLGWVFVPPGQQGLVQRIKTGAVVALGDLVEGIYEGIVTGNNSVFVVPSSVASKLGLEKPLIRPAIQGKHVERYFLETLTHVLFYPYKADGKRTVRIEERELERLYPKVYQYLQEHRANLSGRKYFEHSNKAWYELWNERSFGKQAIPKIVGQEIAAGAKFALSTEEEFYLDTVCGIVLRNKSKAHALYVLGLLNSRLLEYYYKRTTVPKAGGFYIYKTMFLKSLPIRLVDLADPSQKKLHDDLVALVDRMLELNKKLHSLSEFEAEQRLAVEKEIGGIDENIDTLVYDLYGLTPQERKIVESL